MFPKPVADTTPGQKVSFVPLKAGQRLGRHRAEQQGHDGARTADHGLAIQPEAGINKNRKGPAPGKELEPGSKTFCARAPNSTP